MIIAGLEEARARMLAYMVEAGARVTISRKGPSGWEEIAADVPAIVESSRAASGRIDPTVATANDANNRDVTLPHDADLLPADRLTVTAPKGTGVRPGQVLTIGTIDMNSMAPCLKATAVIEENAVERYEVTIERWDDTEGVYLPVLTAMASVVTSKTTVRAEQRGAAGISVLGTLIFDPAPEVRPMPGDSVIGIPWATGSFITRLMPVVGSRLEAAFSYTLGDVT